MRGARDRSHLCKALLALCKGAAARHKGGETRTAVRPRKADPENSLRIGFSGNGEDGIEAGAEVRAGRIT
ncbi:MAG TPA: hypothetical protein VGX68_22535 [Thermoanaerobaculia bacterium]|nr:hypothetical protein [Thermoanaerobaculia bacterium]